MHACKTTVYILQNECLFCKDKVSIWTGGYILNILEFCLMWEKEMGTDHVEIRGNN